ncbi:hypothetical protein [Spirosoma flavum]|uniref:Uncharacterized protein n=1 Tax=Spirosoma flavum TaxID=2048557 RepID=A0ABW6AQU2_9BACT
MKMSTLFSIAFSLIGANSIAQSALSQISSTVGNVNSAAYGASNVNAAVSNTGSAIKGTANTVKDISSLFKKKEKPAETIKEVASNAIIITITNIDYPKLKLIEDTIKPIEGVKSTLKKFNANGSTIDVVYTGKDDQLWDALPEKFKEMFTLIDLGNGKIAIEQKK